MMMMPTLFETKFNKCAKRYIYGMNSSKKKKIIEMCSSASKSKEKQQQQKTNNAEMMRKQIALRFIKVTAKLCK